MTDEQAEKCVRAVLARLGIDASPVDVFEATLAIHETLDAGSGFKIQAGRNISRKEDMSPRGYLQLYMEHDSDIIVTVSEDDEDMDRSGFATVQFCTYSGGGKSQRTLAALRQLAEAMALDSKEDQSRKGVNDESEECFK